MTFSFAIGQEVAIDGTLTDIDNKTGLEGATIKAISGGSTETSTTSNRRGKYSLKIPVGKKYTIEYSKNGYVTKIMDIDLTPVSDEDIPIGGNIFPPIDIDLFENRPNADFSFTKNEPVVKWTWDSKKLRMEWDKDVHKQMKEKIETKLEKADKEAKEGEAKYNQLISEADAHYNKEEYQDALDKYEAAVKIPGKQMEEHPNNRIMELDELLQQQAKEELQKKQSGEKYNNLITEAENLVEKEEYDKAIDKYYEALDIKPDEVHPLDEIDKIRVLLKEKQIKEEYDQLVEMGDNFLEQNSVQAARDKYQRAHDLLPDETYAQEQLDKLEGKLKEEEERLARKKQYDEAIEVADQHFEKEEWEDAKEKYEEAIDLESASNYPKQRLELVEEKLEELAKQKENQEKYDALVEEADEALSNEQYENAINKYEEALTFVEEQYAKDQKKKAEEELENLQNAEARKEKIAELLEDAKNQMANNDFEKAIQDYDAVLGLDEENETAIEGMKKAEEEIEKLKQQEELREQFDELVQQADDLFDEEKWEDAKTIYLEADELIEDDTHVINKLAEVEKELNKLANQEELEAKIDALIDLAENAEEEEEYKTALAKFEEVLTMDDKNKTAQEGVVRMEEKIKEVKEQQSIEEEYNSLITEADNLLEVEKYQDSKEKYEEALALMEEDEYAQEKISEIEQIMSEKAEEIAQKEAYEQAMETGIVALENNSFDNAIEAFEEALSIFEDDDEAKEKLAQAENLKDEFETFSQLKEDGNDLIENEEWTQAKEKFEAAKEINEDEEVKTQLELINQKLNELASEEEKEEKFNELMEEASQLESEDELESAIAKYEKALEVKDDNIPKEKIDELKELLEKRKSQQGAYAEAMEKAKKAFEEEDFAKAIEYYDDALEIEENDADAEKGKTEAKAELKRLAEEEEAYQELLTEAKTKKESDELLEAKALYQEAQKQRPKDAVPQNAIVEIDELLRIKEEESEENEAYNKAIEEADLMAQNFKYDDAIDKYKEASKLKPDEEYPKEKIKELRTLIDQMASSSNKDEEFNEKVQKADLAFSNEDFKESISLYEEALEIKDDEYPKNQIELVEKAIKEKEAAEIEEKYQLAMKKGNQALADEEYQTAINEYDEALELKDSDPTALEQRNKAAQLLEKQKQEELANQEKNEEFDKIISEADNLFDSERFIDAKEKYEEALAIKGNDAYALERREESIQKSKEKTRAQAEAQYQKVLDKADEYFDEENWDKAIGLYERAISLKENDQYPKDKIDEINQIIAGPVKKDQALEYLGKEESISLVEGAALLEKGDRERKNLKTQKTVKRIDANRKNFQEKENQDRDERLGSQNEIEKIKDRRAEGFDEQNKNKQQLAVNLDDEMFQISQQRVQENKYERGSILRQNEEINFIIDDFNNIHEEKNDKHLVNADKVDEIKIDFEKHRENINTDARNKWIDNDREMTKIADDLYKIHDDKKEVQLENVDKVDRIQINYDRQSNKKSKKERNKWIDNDQEMIKIADDRRADTERAEDLRKVNDEVVRSINDYQEEQRHQSQQDNYDKLQGIERDAVLAKAEKARRESDKAKIQKLIEEDIAALQNVIKDKNYDETQQVRKEALKADALLVAASEQYRKTTENADDNRLTTVENIKTIEKRNDEEIRLRSKRKYQKIQDNVDEAESILIMNEIAKHEMDEGHTELRKRLDREEDRTRQIAREQERTDQLKRRQTENEIENTKILNKQTHSEKRAQIDESNEALKGDQIKLEASKRGKNSDQREKLLKNQSEIDKQDNTKKEKPIIPNTIGDEYPEGVTEESYIKKDKEGIPVQIIVRRIVVTEGRGVEYRRIQTRNGVAYSRNGESITEAIWNKETQNANLVQN